MSQLRRDLSRAINVNNAERGSNTPDFVLGEFLAKCLEAFDGAVNTRATTSGTTELVRKIAEARKIADDLATALGYPNVPGRKERALAAYRRRSW
jgi:hypothetical protein